MSNPQRPFGHLPNVPVGTCFSSRDEARVMGVHRHEQAGISGTKREGADAIVLNGGYTDDVDRGELIIYTGHGGQQNKRQVADQNLDDPGNAALVTSMNERLPVRVIRGYKGDPKYSPKTGYRYDGLYRVVRFWHKERPDGLLVIQYLMVQIGSSLDRDDLVIDLEFTDEPTAVEGTGGPVERKPTTVNKMQRNPAVASQVKMWNEDTCQVCRKRIDLPNGACSEAAHIRGLGVPHSGPDITQNVLCLCPNDHRRFDYGAIYLSDDLRIIDALNGEVQQDLTVVKRHEIDLKYVQYHRDYWVRTTKNVHV